MTVLYRYGKKVVEECKEGFDQEVKEKIYAFIQSQEKTGYPYKELKQIKYFLVYTAYDLK